MIVLTNDPALQIIVSFVLSLTVRFIKFTLYLIVVQPFKCKRTFVFNLLNEFHVMAFNVLLLNCLNLEGLKRNRRMKDLIVVIVSSLLLSAGFNFLEIFIMVIKWCRKRVSTAKVEPVVSNQTGEAIKISGVKENNWM